MALPVMPFVVLRLWIALPGGGEVAPRHWVGGFAVAPARHANLS